MILCEWDAPEGNPDNVAYTCMLSYPIIVSHLRFNFLCLLLLYSNYLFGLNIELDLQSLFGLLCPALLMAETPHPPRIWTYIRGHY
jgi:hypothetical protein